MNTDEKKFDRILAVFRSEYACYGEAPTLTCSGNWEQQVMRRIRLLSPNQAESTAFTLFTDLVWRLAPISAVLIIVFTIFISQFNAISEVELAGLILNDPVGAGLAHIFN